MGATLQAGSRKTLAPMSKKPVQIVFASDNHYTQPLGVALFSMLTNFKSETYVPEITILDGGISAENAAKIQALGRKFDILIRFEKMDPEVFQRFHLVNYFTSTAYFRLLIPRIFKDKADSVLYLDCDIMVLGNLAALAETNLADYHLAAVRDAHGEALLKNHYCPFYAGVRDYFNSGVMVLNVRKLNADAIPDKALSFLKDHSKELNIPDQDVLNILCADTWLPLDTRWNTQVDRNAPRMNPQPEVVHYIMRFKPWHFSYHNHYQKQYMRYLKAAWPNYRIQPVPLTLALKQFLKRTPFSIPAVRLFKRFAGIPI